MEITAELSSFISHYITSLEKLEILLILFASPKRTWTSRQVFEIIRSSEGSISDKMKELTNDGFLFQSAQLPDNYQFASENKEMTTKVKELSECYSLRRVKVIEAIFAPKNDAAKDFANAFKLRRN